MNRRAFLRHAIIGSLVFVPTEGFSLANQKRKGADVCNESISLYDEDVILFTGDSITNASRIAQRYAIPNDTQALGKGYVKVVSSYLNNEYAHKRFKIYNTGVSGNTVKNVYARLQRDVIDLKPTVINLLLGVNDCNVAFRDEGKSNPEKFEQDYRQLLESIKQKLPDTRLVICEPFAHKGVREKIDGWFAHFHDYRKVAKNIAIEFGATFIPLQEAFDNAIAASELACFTKDGIHPSLGGVGLMSNVWISHLKKID